MIQSYEQIFSQRADAYQQAMELFPRARDQEFQLTVAAARIRPAEIVCDAPAGGGYLRAYLPNSVGQYLAVETAPDFIGHCELGNNDRIIESSLQQISLADNSVDACISLACTHHLEDKAQFFREAARILKPGGRLVMADVEAGTAVDRFLNGFVDRNNSMGHSGVFLTQYTADLVSTCGFSVQADQVRAFPWCFQNRDDMGLFCKLLFGMNKAEASAVTTGIEESPGLMAGPAPVNMAWGLRFITAICC